MNVKNRLTHIESQAPALQLEIVKTIRESGGDGAVARYFGFYTFEQARDFVESLSEAALSAEAAERHGKTHKEAGVQVERTPWAQDLWAWSFTAEAVEKGMSIAGIARMLSEEKYGSRSGKVVTADLMYPLLYKYAGVNRKEIERNIRGFVTKMASEKGASLSTEDVDRINTLLASFRPWANDQEAWVLIHEGRKRNMPERRLVDMLSTLGYTTSDNTALPKDAIGNLVRREPGYEDDLVGVIANRTANVEPERFERAAALVEAYLATQAKPRKLRTKVVEAPPASKTPYDLARERVKQFAAAYEPTGSGAPPPEPSPDVLPDVYLPEKPVIAADSSSEEEVGEEGPRGNPFNMWGETYAAISYMDTSMTNPRMVTQPVQPAKYVALHEAKALAWQIEGKSRPPSSYPTLEEARAAAEKRKG